MHIIIGFVNKSVYFPGKIYYPLLLKNNSTPLTFAVVMI